MIFVECKPDFTLVKSLTNITRRGIIHEYNKGEVCNRLREQTNCKGLVDEDPSSGQPRYIKEARLENDFIEHDIKVLHHDQTGNCIIVICPMLEEWVLVAARQAGVDVRKYGLPNNARQLHREINIILDKFEALLRDLKGSSRRLKTLKGLQER